MRRQVDWFYHRRGCRGSRLARRFLAARGYAVAEEVDDGAAPVDGPAAFTLLGQVKELVTPIKGDVHVFDLAGGNIFRWRRWSPGGNGRAETVWEEEDGCEVDQFASLQTWLLTSAGSLRTPALRKGGTLLVGFSEAAADRAFPT